MADRRKSHLLRLQAATWARRGDDRHSKDCDGDHCSRSREGCGGMGKQESGAAIGMQHGGCCT